MSDRTAELLTMKDERGNRGFVESLIRFGTDAERQAARRKLATWDRENRQTEPDGAA